MIIIYMSKTKRQRQDTDYVLGHFGKSKAQARKRYESFVKSGLRQGRKNELTGGGLIRSLGGWTEAREALKGGVHIMSDERILGESDFQWSEENQLPKMASIHSKGKLLNFKRAIIQIDQIQKYVTERQVCG